MPIWPWCDLELDGLQLLVSQPLNLCKVAVTLQQGFTKECDGSTPIDRCNHTVTALHVSLVEADACLAFHYSG